jgi:hypothetical protein
MEDNKLSRILDAKLVKFLLPEPSTPYQRYNSDEMIKYGSNNLYPEFLLKMYNKSPAHGAIVDNKATYTQGKGLRYKGGQVITSPLNTEEPIYLTIDKILKDFNIFNYFAVEVLYNKRGQAVQYIHVPAQLIRTNMMRSKFWYRDNWAGNQSALIEFAPAENYTAGADISTSKIFFFAGYRPSTNRCYPAPEYNAGLEAVATDAAINTFNLNNIKSHFSVSTLITFFQGSNVAEKTKEEILRKILDSYTGEDGVKVLIDFQNINGKPAQVDNISPGDWDKAYIAVAEKSQSDIFICHQVTSPMLFGVKTEGQLGGRDELETSFEIFKDTYVMGKRLIIEGALNKMFEGSALINGPIEFIDKPLFGNRVESATREKIYTINELRALDGKPLLPNGKGDRLLADPVEPPLMTSIDPSPTEPISPPLPELETAVVPRTLAPERKPEAKAGEKKDRTGWVKKGPKEEDFEKIKDFGLSKESFIVLTRGKPVRSRLEADYIRYTLSREDDIAKHIVNGDISGKTIEDLIKELAAADLETDAAELKDIFATMKEAGIADIAITDGRISVQTNTEQDGPRGDILTMYEYVLRSDMSGPVLLPTSRGFCRKLIDNDKYYSRSDIQTMSAIFGYDVFEHAGGWYHNPDTDETEEHCRHEFVTVRLKRK